MKRISRSITAAFEGNMDINMNFMLLWILGVVGTVLSSGCPGSGDIGPCSCMDTGDDLQLFCHDEEMSLRALKRVLGLFDENRTMVVELYYIHLHTVPTDYFKGFNIRVLDISHCHLNPIPDAKGRILVGLEDSLQEFSMIASITRENLATKLDMSHLSKLTEIHFSYNAIPELPDEWFANGPSSLTHLFLDHNDIETLGINAFAYLTNLQELWLHGNTIGEVKRSMLPNPAKYLDELNLDENALESFPEDFFTNMPSLEYVSAQYNKFKTLPQETFEKISKQLVYIDVEGNPLNCDDSVLKWMFDSEHLPHISGRCASPPERDGDDLWEVIKSHKSD